MDKFIKYLKANDFVCVSTPSVPVVVHCVPGAGKSSLVRSFLQAEPKAEAFTFGVPDYPNLSGKYIKHYSKAGDSVGRFKILDEYNCGAFEGDFDVLIGDPLQFDKDDLPEAHFIKTTTHRFGKETCKLLRQLGYEVESDKEDQVLITDFYGPLPEGTIIALESPVINYLKSYGLDVLGPCNVRGTTFTAVTLFVSKSLESLKGADLFLCLTRHREKLVIRSLLHESEKSTGLQQSSTSFGDW